MPFRAEGPGTPEVVQNAYLGRNVSPRARFEHERRRSNAKKILQPIWPLYKRAVTKFCAPYDIGTYDDGVYMAIQRSVWDKPLPILVRMVCLNALCFVVLWPNLSTCQHRSWMMAPTLHRIHFLQFSLICSKTGHLKCVSLIFLWSQAEEASIRDYRILSPWQNIYKI